jgi:hypothetical protein
MKQQLITKHDQEKEYITPYLKIINDCEEFLEKQMSIVDDTLEELCREHGDDSESYTTMKKEFEFLHAVRQELENMHGEVSYWELLPDNDEEVSEEPDEREEVSEEPHKRENVPEAPLYQNLMAHPDFDKWSGEDEAGKSLAAGAVIVISDDDWPALQAQSAQKSRVVRLSSLVEQKSRLYHSSASTASATCVLSSSGMRGRPYLRSRRKARKASNADQPPPTS